MRKDSKGKKKIFNVGLILFYIYHIIIGMYSSPSFLSFASFTVFYKILQLPMLIYSFYYFSELTKTSTDRLFLLIVRVGVSFVIINTTLYFVELPIWGPNDYQKWWGRISCGYPTMDVVSLAYTLIILLYFENLRICLVSRWIYTFIICSGIALNATGTGLVLVVAIIIVSLGYLLFLKSPSILKKSIIGLVGGIIILLLEGTAIMEKYYPYQYENMLVLMKDKSQILYFETGNDVASLSLREKQYNDAMIKHQNSSLKRIFGVGLSSVTYDAKVRRKDQRYIFIEDQFGFNKICYGYLGSSFLIMFLLVAFWEVATMRQVSWTIRIFFGLSILIFSVNSRTLLSLVLFSNIAFFALFYATLKRVKNDNKYYLENFESTKD
jgi:hypothetical protein